MKKILKIAGIIFAIAMIGGAWFAYTPVDLRPDYLGDNIAEKDYTKGKILMQEMQAAYGGKENWLAQKTGTFVQVADWYEDKFGLSGWDELPQQLQLTSTLGTDDSELSLLNGPNTGKTWGVQNWKYYETAVDGTKNFVEDEKYLQKMVFKNYWFQFPFRIGEAPIIAYAGESTVKGETYDLLYATWGSETPNRAYDQYILYLDKETKLVEWLHFTIRDKLKLIHSTAQFTDFRTINGVVAPFNQYITRGTPEEEGAKFHENRYQWVQFGEERVER